MNEEHIEPGELVAGQYRIDRLVGSGGFAQVYRAVQSDLDRTVAVKILRPLSEQDRSTPSKRAVDRFEREAKLVSKLQNPHTVTVYDYGTLPSGRLYMVLEHVDGTTLAELVDREGALPVQRLVPILVQILDSLREAHALEIVHRDIKPGNIMIFDRIGQRDAVKVLDFGVAKSVAREQSAARHRDEQRELTAQGAVIGTPKYMSPEQLMAKPLRPASDLFSVGILAYLMYAGDVPYRSNDAASILRRMKAFEHDLGALEGAPELLRSVARKLLAPEVDERYASAEAALEDLDRRDEVEVETQRSGALETSASATFPMGFDPEGRTETTELTSVESRVGSEVSRVLVDGAFSGESDSEVRSGEGSDRLGVKSTSAGAADTDDASDGGSRWRSVTAVVATGLLAAAVVGVYTIATSDPSSPSTEPDDGERAEPRAAPRVERAGSAKIGVSVRVGRRTVEEAVSTGAEAADEAASIRREDRGPEAPMPPGPSVEESRARAESGGGSGERGTTQSGDERSEHSAGAGQPRRERDPEGSNEGSAEGASAPAIEPLDRSRESESNRSEGDETERGLEFEAWE